MKIRFLYVLAFFLFYYLNVKGDITGKDGNLDTSEIIKLNKKALDNRLTNPDQTVEQANRVLIKAINIKYNNGIAESNRIIGIGYYYLNQPDSAIDHYLNAIKYFKVSGNKSGEAKVYNNIGNLYLGNDNNQATEYFNSALAIAKKLNDQKLVASVCMNLGNVYCREKSFSKALQNYDLSRDIFIKTKDTIDLIQCLQNKGVIYYNQHDLNQAESLLIQANEQAKALDLNNAIASINLTLTSVFLAKNDFVKAEKYLKEGLYFAQLVKNTKREDDYNYTWYEFFMKRGDYKNAVFKLRDIYKKDSVTFKSNGTTKLTIANEQFKQREKDRETERKLETQKFNQQMFIASSLVACLLLVVIVLLINNVNRKTKTNNRLTELNLKISEQKENLNQINHHLEEIIDERTKDLQVKNKKLADYSLHLSHQIRGPIATLKGLLNLEKDKLIEAEECINLMNKCVSEIDDNIIDMSSMLHEPGKL